jgi:nucleoside-diphosphate-sugar epimerase
MSKVLVTGAAGQVGARLVRQLLARNYEVRGTLLPEDPAADRLVGLDIERVEGDLRDPEFVREAVEGVDAVLHTANLVGAQHFENNVMCTFNVAKACAENADALSRLVSVSSSGVYPNDSHAVACAYHPVDENHPRRPIDDYSLSKLIGEDIVASFARASGLRAAMVRPSGIVSGDAILSRWSVGFVGVIMQAGMTTPGSEMYLPGGGEPWKELEKMAVSPDQPCAATGPDGRPWMYQLVDARDVALGIVCAMESEAAVGEVFNISAPRPITYPEAAAIMAEVTRMEPLEYRAPVRWVFDLDNTKARSRIGYRPRWGIREMIEDAMHFKAGMTDGLS